MAHSVTVSTVTALALTPSWSRVRRGLITDETAALRFTHGRNELRLPSLPAQQQTVNSSEDMF